MMKVKLFAMLAISLCSLAILAPQCQAEGTQWGAYTENNNLAQFESLVGKSANIQAVFVGWGTGNGFPSEYKSIIADKSKTLLIFWEPSVNYDSILSGKWDSYITSFAAEAKNYGGQVILAPFHEMNGNWDVWDGTVGTNTPQKMIDSWRYVHNFFTAASNVKFGWAVNNDSVPDTQANAITAYYPGAAYVDYVGIDGFNFGNPWQSWQSTFSSAINTVKQYNKPIYIFSTASCQGNQKAQWITEMGAGIKQGNIAGWVWFNANKECDWRVNSDANSLSAFKAIIEQSAILLPVSATSTAPVVNPVPTTPTTPTAPVVNVKPNNPTTTQSRWPRQNRTYYHRHYSR